MVTGTVKLSFYEIAEAKASGTLTWDVYLHKLLTSWTGVDFKEYETDTDHHDLQFFDPFAHTIWHESLTFYVRGGIEDITPIEAVFKTYRTSTLEDVKAAFEQVRGLPAKANVDTPAVRAIQKDQPARATVNALALLALQHRRADVLDYCLNDIGYDGPPDTSFFREAVVYVDDTKDAAIFEVLERSTFRSVFPKEEYCRASTRESYRDGGVGPLTVLNFDVGGKFPVDW